MLALPISSQNASNSGILPTRPTNEAPDSGRSFLGTLERYRLLELLGRGGMAEVFLSAWEVAPGVVRPAVIKRLYEHYSDDPGHVRMFVDEARLVCQLDHENIVKTYEVGLIDGHICIAMEYLEGQTLQQLMRRSWTRGELPIALSTHIAACAPNALVFAHAATDQRGIPNEIVHRDVSPQNIFITNAGQVKVLDFGIAKAKSHEQRTSTGVVKGKFAYIAPEQANGNAVDARADIWSLGVVLWEMLAGKRLFKADGEAATLHATLNREIPFLPKLRPEVPVDLAMCVARSLQRDPERRYASAHAMLADLQTYLGRAKPRPDAAAVSAMMQQSFVEEVAQQRLRVAQLIQLQSGQSCSPSRPPPVPCDVASSHGNTSSAEGTNTELLLRQLRRRNRFAFGFLFVAVAALASMCVWLWHSSVDTNARVASQRPEAQPNGPIVAVAPHLSDAPHPETLQLASPAVEARSESSEVEASQASQSRPSPKANKAKKTVPAHHGEPVTAPVASATASGGDPLAMVQYGYVTIDTTPWSSVSWKGKYLGQTPLLKAKLPVGTQVLSLRNADLNIEMQYVVSVVADQTLVKRIGLK